MLELAEVLTMAEQLNREAAGKRVEYVLPPVKPHKFCWFSGAPEDYEPALKGRRVMSAEGFGIFVELSFEGGEKLCFNDGVNIRLLQGEKIPGNYQLLIGLDDGTALVFTVAMYGSILLHRHGLDNEYYQKSRAGISPFSEEFAAYFCPDSFPLEYPDRPGALESQRNQPSDHAGRNGPRYGAGGSCCLRFSV